jgi:sarcosine oxidase subunit beta
MRVTVIGAGVTGLSIAFHLLERGIGPVAILDRGGVGAGASGVQPGGVRQQWSTPAACAMARESLAFYGDFPARFGTRAQARFDRCGYLFVAHEPGSLRRLVEAVQIQHEAGVPSTTLAPRDAAALVPGLNTGGMLGAAHCAEDGYFDRPQAVVEAFAGLAVAKGARLARDEARSIDRDGQGWRIETGAGSFASDAVVVAAASATAKLVAPLGFTFPVADDPRRLFFSEPVASRLLEPLVIAVDRGVAAKQLADGRLLASDLRATGDAVTEEDAWRRRLREELVSLLPALEYVPLPVLVEGTYDMTPDAQPIVDELDDGLWVAAGFSGHGFMIAPAVGRLVADAIAGRDLPTWRDALRADRFSQTGHERETHVI